MVSDKIHKAFRIHKTLNKNIREWSIFPIYPNYTLALKWAVQKPWDWVLP